MEESRYRPVSLRNPFYHAPVLYAETTGSTMEDAAELLAESAARPAAPGTVLSAGFQSRGAGRTEGRTWHALPGESLLFSLLLPEDVPNMPVTLFPLAVAAGLAVFLENVFGLAVEIKWPNDVMVSDRKTAGVLCRKLRGWLVAGVGLNCRQRDFPGTLQGSATSLACEYPGRVPPPLKLLPGFLETLKASLETGTVVQTVEDRLWRKGQRYSAAAGVPGSKKIISGEALGIRNDGALLLKEACSGDITAVVSGEIAAE